MTVSRRPAARAGLKGGWVALSILAAMTQNAWADRRDLHYRAQQPGFYGESPRFAVRPNYGYYRPFGFGRPRGYMRPYGYQSPPVIAPFGPPRRPNREFRPF